MEETKEYFIQGLQAYKARDLFLALDCFTKVTTLCPQEGNPWYNLGATFKRLGQPANALKAFDEALIKYEEAIKTDSHNKIAWYAKATVLIEKWLLLNTPALYEEAMIALDKTLEIDQNFETAQRCKELLEFRLAVENLKCKGSDIEILGSVD